MVIFDMAKNLTLMDKKVINECMRTLASAMMVKDNKTEAWLYFQFEDLVNETFGESVNNSDIEGFYNDNDLLFKRWHIARKEYLETINETRDGAR